jgi:hypothetical protein
VEASLTKIRSALASLTWNDAQEIRRQFDRIQREVHKPQEEDPDDRSRSGNTSDTDAETPAPWATAKKTTPAKPAERFRQCLAFQVQEAMLQQLNRPATAAAQSVHQEVSAAPAKASYLSTVEKARAQATMLMLTGIVAHDNMSFVVPSTAANVAWYEKPHLPSAQESEDERILARCVCGTSNGTSTGSFSNAHYQTATVCSSARMPTRPRR